MNRKGISSIVIILIIVGILAVAGGVWYWQKQTPQQPLNLGPLSLLKQKLATGTPQEKEEVLDTFMANNTTELVPDVIKAILDDTVLPRHDDTGWGNVYHQAATAMSQFAYKIDGVSLEKRGREEFSFYYDVGTANEQRRRKVHDNWLKWWEDNKNKIEIK